jgi:lipoprotein-anchoring transpeptidase ErfK/SrfK
MNRRWAVTTVAVLTVLVGVAGVGAAAAGIYDRSNSHRLLPGTSIQGIAVGGMPTADATRLLRDRLEMPLHREITVRAGQVSVVTTPWDMGLHVDVRAAVRRAQGHASGGGMVSRAWRRLFTNPERVVSAPAKWQPAQLDAALGRIAEKVRTEPVNPTVDGKSGWAVVVPGRNGLELDVERSKEALADAVQLGDPVVDLVTRDVPPAVDKDAFKKVVLVRTGENKLYLYQNGTIAKSWPVATGSPSYATPTGTWKVIDKVVNPTWYNPGSSWARGMPARIGPGPNNPLGEKALELDAPAILIHGTPDRSSIGYNVSHGCIRMLAEHEAELFDLVDVGTPVVIVDAGTPQPRTVTPNVTDPAAAAAVNF